MKHSVKEWIFATRPWSFPASATSALVAFSYVFFRFSSQSELVSINWCYGILAILGAVIFQAGSNVANDYVDYQHKVDTKESIGINRLLIDEVFEPKSFLRYSVILLSIGILLGVFLMVNTGIDLLWIGIIGALSGFFYYKLKYIALGDLLIYIIFGPMIMLGTVFVMTTDLDPDALMISIPVGFLIVNILHANNTRDMMHDGKANIKTQAMLLGVRGAIIQYMILAVGAYFAVAVMAAFGILHPLSLIVFVTLPLTIMNIKKIRRAEFDKPELINNMDEMSAKLVLAFGVLLAVSNFIAAYL
ncbi:MAG TPA: prenyltransferase [Spirochaetota bacterium]|nr:prenyltransferase [Spirochaetota bacterium]